MRRKKKKDSAAGNEKLDFVRQRIVQLRQFLLSNNQTLSVSHDGMSTTFDRKGALEELAEMERQEKVLTQGSGWIRNIDMSGSC
ncbi:MAG: hypothetical protein FWE67_15270 [Planctomycetaceae bacterium]|nr:hypothetical protein [Planctomycetaceae bacterium]